MYSTSTTVTRRFRSGLTTFGAPATDVGAGDVADGVDDAGDDVVEAGDLGPVGAVVDDMDREHGDGDLGAVTRWWCGMPSHCPTHTAGAIWACCG